VYSFGFQSPGRIDKKREEQESRKIKESERERK
jgi:hypothetical protein